MEQNTPQKDIFSAIVSFVGFIIAAVAANFALYFGLTKNSTAAIISAAIAALFAAGVALLLNLKKAGIIKSNGAIAMSIIVIVLVISGVSQYFVLTNAGVIICEVTEPETEATTEETDENTTIFVSMNQSDNRGNDEKSVNGYTPTPYNPEQSDTQRKDNIPSPTNPPYISVPVTYGTSTTTRTTSKITTTTTKATTSPFDIWYYGKDAKPKFQKVSQTDAYNFSIDIADFGVLENLNIDGDYLFKDITKNVYFCISYPSSNSFYPLTNDTTHDLYYSGSRQYFKVVPGIYDISFSSATSDFIIRNITISESLPRDATLRPKRLANRDSWNGTIITAYPHEYIIDIEWK